jgi:hypothetical protein
MLDFNDATDQTTFELIPADTIATLSIKVRGGGAGPDGTLRRSKDGKSEGLDLEFTVVDGPFVRRKLWSLLTLSGESEGHAEAGRIAAGTLRAVLESARGIRPDDQSEAAKQARRISSYLELDGVQFVARIGVAPPRDNYSAKNKLASVITPEMSLWHKPDTAAPAPGAAAPASPSGGAIARPAWSK